METNNNIKERSNELITRAIENEMVFLYEDELLDKASCDMSLHIPFDIVLMSPIMNNRLCRHRSLKLSLLLDNSILINADIYSLSDQNSKSHSFVYHDDFIYDTTRSCKFNKDIYYQLELPSNAEYLKGRDLFNYYNLAKYSFDSIYNQLNEIMENIKDLDINFYNYLDCELSKYYNIVMNNEYEMTLFILNIVKHFEFMSLYDDRLNDSINNFEKKLLRSR